MTIISEQRTSAPALSADEARQVLLEMVAVVRTIFASGFHQPQGEPQPTPEPHAEPFAQPAAQAHVDQTPAYEPQPTVAEQPLTEPALPPALALPQSEPIAVPQTAAVASVPMPSAISAEGSKVATPGVTTPTAAPSTPALAAPTAQPVEVPAFDQAPTPAALPVPDLAPPVGPHLPERHSMAMLQEIAFLDD